MKRCLFLALAAWAVVSLHAACSAPDTGWKLVWSDEFDYNGLPDSVRWNFDTRGNHYGWGNNEAQWYTDKELKNAWVGDGVLHIVALRDTIGGRKYSSARLTTTGKGDWKYGRVEVRAKLPGGVGVWPAIWMVSTDNNYGGWPRSGEIDIMEYVGCQADTVFSTIHTERFNHVKGTQVGKTLRLPSATSEFHVYMLEWEADQLRSYVDGEPYFTFSNDGSGYESWPFDQRFHLILNVAIGGNFGGKKGIDDGIFPVTLEVDYVRVYQK